MAGVLLGWRDCTADPAAAKSAALATAPRRPPGRPERGRDEPDDQRERHREIGGDQRAIVTEAVGEAAEQEAADRAAEADRADQQHRRGMRDAVVDRVGAQMHERHEHAERAGEARAVEREEARRSDRIAQRRAGRLHGGAVLRRVAVGHEPALARIAFDQQRQAGADDRGGDAEHHIGGPPAEMRDQQRGEAGGERAAAREPALHGPHGGNIREADPDADREPARADAVGERSAHAAEAEVEKAGEREHDGH
jgi:hypothetical protein